LLAILIEVGGFLSAMLTNDVVVVAMTPLLVSITLARGLNPAPFLLAFCFAANTGSSGTLIGSPQNMIAAEGLSLSFNGFLMVAAVPALISLPIVWAIVSLIYRGRWLASVGTRARAVLPADRPIGLDRSETTKALAVTIAVILAFMFSPWRRELVALAGARVLLVNRKISSRDVLKQVGGDLLLLIMGLFVVNAALAATGLPGQVLASLKSAGLDLNNPLTLLLVGSVLSNIVGNNPNVILLVPYLNPAVRRAWRGAGAGHRLFKQSRHCRQSCWHHCR
jgi:Na+/H+ antiporter NhaD/arsenite permease-like protein